MKLIAATMGLAAMCAVGVIAQTSTSTTKEQTKVEVKDGKTITVSGCLERNPGGGYMVTSDGGGFQYALVTDDAVAKHLGERVQITGKATDVGDGHVKIDSKVEGTSGRTSQATTEAKGDLGGMHYLGVKSVKKISSSCK